MKKIFYYKNFCNVVFFDSLTVIFFQYYQNIFVYSYQNPVLTKFSFIYSYQKPVQMKFWKKYFIIKIYNFYDKIFLVSLTVNNFQYYQNMFVYSYQIPVLTKILFLYCVQNPVLTKFWKKYFIIKILMMLYFLFH